MASGLPSAVVKRRWGFSSSQATAASLSTAEALATSTGPTIDPAGA